VCWQHQRSRSGPNGAQHGRVRGDLLGAELDRRLVLREDRIPVRHVTGYLRPVCLEQTCVLDYALSLSSLQQLAVSVIERRRRKQLGGLRPERGIILLSQLLEQGNLIKERNGRDRDPAQLRQLDPQVGSEVLWWISLILMHPGTGRGGNIARFEEAA
jgi:hypothetical protein